MLIYAVNLSIDTNIKTNYLNWLQQHIATILQLPGFQTAQILEKQNTATTYDLTVHYYIDNQKNLDHYLSHHAPKLRQEGIDKFQDQFSASREIFILKDTLKRRN